MANLRLSLTFNKYWALFVGVKLVYMFFALFIVAKYISLGDTYRYLNSSVTPSLDIFLHSTIMMEFITGVFSNIFGSILANIPFVLMATYGIYYSVTRLNLNKRQLFFLLFILSFPSFGIWTSVASKEAVAVFYMGVLLGFIIDLIKGNRNRDVILILFSFYLCAIFKPQYLIGIFALLIFIGIAKTFCLRAFGKLFLLMLFIVFSLLFLFLFKDEINAISFVLPQHFNPDAASTRENTFWINNNDVFFNAPYGIYLAFTGPTLAEALVKPIQLMVWLESMLLITLFIFMVLRICLVSITTSRFNIYMASIFFVVSIWILFVAYPFGVLNPGSAIRYRSGYYSFIVVLFYFCYLETIKNNNFWVRSNKKLNIGGALDIFVK